MIGESSLRKTAQIAENSTPTICQLTRSRPKKRPRTASGTTALSRANQPAPKKLSPTP